MIYIVTANPSRTTLISYIKAAQYHITWKSESIHNELQFYCSIRFITKVFETTIFRSSTSETTAKLQDSFWVSAAQGRQQGYAKWDCPLAGCNINMEIEYITIANKIWEDAEWIRSSEAQMPRRLCNCKKISDKSEPILRCSETSRYLVVCRFTISWITTLIL